MASREKGLGSSSTNPARPVPRRRAAFIATAPPKEWPTRARGRRPRCWKSPSTSSAWSVRVCGRLGGQLELSPYPNRSTATTWKRDASSPVRERHCCLPLTELCTRMTGSPAPDASNPTRQRPDWIADTDIPPIGGPVLPVLLMPAAYSGAVVAWRIPDDGPAGCPCLGPAPGCSSVACRCRHRAHDRACPSATVVGVRSVKGDFAVRLPATDDPADVGPCDYVLFCVKAFDTEPAAVRLGPLLGEDTAVVSLQTGVDNEEKLARVVGPAHVMGGAAFIFAGISEPGVIVHTGGPTTITFGELDG